MSRKRNNSWNRQIDRDEAPQGPDALPSRYEMIRAIERVAQSWRERRRQFELEARAAQMTCAEKNWDPEYVRRYECKVAQEQYCGEQMERCEADLSELYSGKTKGWPFRNEVFRSGR